MKKEYENEDKDVSDLMEKLNRSERSIRKKAQYMGLRRLSNTSRIRELNSYERGFIEGFLDADGYISLSARKTKHRAPNIKVGFTNNCIPFLEKAMKILGVEKRLINKKGTESYELRLVAWDAYNLLKQISLIIKEDKRLTALEIHDYVQSVGGRGINQTTTPNDYSVKIDEIMTKRKP